MKKKTTFDKINLITKDLFPNVSKDDILGWDGPKFLFKGQPVSRETMTSLASQAKTIKSLELYKALMDEMKTLAQKKIFEDTETVEDLKIARMILWTIDVLERKVDKISKM